MFKYPRTQHIEGSRLQVGDEDLDIVPFADVKGKHLIVEEKIDGGNCGISFHHGRLQLQSRGHYLTGGPREIQFSQLKAWAPTIAEYLHLVLSDRYVMYGEWMAHKHTVFYDRLPHLFIEFDVLDTQTGRFLSTKQRHQMLHGCGITHVPVLAEGAFETVDELLALIKPSLYPIVA